MSAHSPARIHGLPLRAVSAAVLAALLVSVLAVPAAGAESGRATIPASATPYGRTYSQWAAAWWTWALSAPVTTNPVLDDSGIHCGVGQSGPVWFLAGTFGDAPVHRSCRVPAGRALLVPVINLGYFAFEDDPPEQREEVFVRAQVAAAATATDLELTVDGLGVDVTRSYEESVLFSVTLPDDNLFGLPEGFLLDPCVDAGFYVMLLPLSRGSHTVHIGGELGEFALDVTYSLSVGS